ncbi:RNA polymerase sigma factor [Kriegella aquimaris]|uniref:RNA polymerase sigma-70 factor, ECF subfamily n=1 Tax=Kriegella aquimaris TaxID=192904 RepID=A0A1G9TMC9_9FLAO|nr:sigma-70 family RNA polymerase sigma factor [Kriegella aquimaris]SDM48936.1 RNA polymerase sigma-70 factor, ECF subfamily [Kriegella aquimaris]
MSAEKSYTNELLVTQFRNGNKQAFQKLFELYWESMFVQAKAILSDGEIAKDVVQEIWVELWKSKENKVIVNFEAYIFKAVRYGCFKYLRDNKFNAVQLYVIDSLQLSNHDVENQHDLEETQIVIANSLKELSPRCQQIFRLSRIEDNSNEEIALHLGISKRSVENQVSLALKAIRENLGILHNVPFIIFFLC